MRRMNNHFNLYRAPAFSRHSLYRAPVLHLCSISDPGALSVSGPGILYIGAQRSLRRGPTFSISDPILSPGPALSGRIGPGASGRGALCIGAALSRLSRSRAPPLSRRPSRAPNVLVLRPGTLSDGARFSVSGPQLKPPAQIRKSSMRSAVGPRPPIGMPPIQSMRHVSVPA